MAEADRVLVQALMPALHEGIDAVGKALMQNDATRAAIEYRTAAELWVVLGGLVTKKMVHGC